MAKVPSKGTVLQIEITVTLTAIAQLTEVSRSGAESETWDSTTLDGGVGKTYEQTGYSEGGTVDCSGYFDPAAATHQAITDLITTPADKNMKIIYADSGTSEEVFVAAGVSHEVTASLSEGLQFSSSFKVDGLPTFIT